MTKRDRKHDRDELDLEDPLGLAGEPVPHEPSDRIKASNDEESIRRRRARAGLGPDIDPIENDSTRLGDRREGGATGIDMGSGGSGTNVSDRGTT